MKEETKKRRQTIKYQKKDYFLRREDRSEERRITKVVETSTELAEGLQVVQEMARAYAGTIEYYKAEHGGSHSHDEAIKETESLNEWRRKQIEGMQPEKISWDDIAAVAEAGFDEAFSLWIRLREAADDELLSGRRAARFAGHNTEAYAMAQFIAIRDSFADQWQPHGGIELAMIDMLTVAFSLQMYWTTTAHRRAIETHDTQEKALNRFESKGWKSPYQGEANAVEQAYKLADGYNRQFLRVLRQLRDLRRYAPVIIQNNGGQVNVGTQQVNVKQ
jgi:hypothetical protein